MSENQSTQLLETFQRDDRHENEKNENSKLYKENVKRSKDKLWVQIRNMIIASFIFSLALFAGFYFLISSDSSA